MTRLPTKCLATACWAFIVVKTTRLETAPLLDFEPLHCANIECYQQIINKCLLITWGQIQDAASSLNPPTKQPALALIVCEMLLNRFQLG